MTGIMTALTGFGTDGVSAYGGEIGMIIQPPDRYSIYAATVGAHPTHPQAIAVTAFIMSGGGSGMGSRPNMNFSASDLPYAFYGRKGGPACVDVMPARTVIVASDGQTIPWPAHGFQSDQPLFVTGNQSQLWYVHGTTITPNSFRLSPVAYMPPNIPDIYIPHAFGAGVQLELNPYAHCTLGGDGGGIIGDQANPGKPIGIYFGNTPYPHSMYWYGSHGDNALGCGGRGGGGGGPYGGGGGVSQIGAEIGNAGIDLQGGGGSGAGFLHSDGSYPIDQFGPGGGAGGTAAEISLPLKPSYMFNAPGFAIGGEPATGGFRGGNGGMGLVMFKERIGP